MDNPNWHNIHTNFREKWQILCTSLAGGGIGGGSISSSSNSSSGSSSSSTSSTSSSSRNSRLFNYASSLTQII
jgi:hypothetical protein